MKLHKLGLQKAQHTKKKDLVVVKLPVKVVLPQKVIKVDRAVPVTKAKWRMKVDRCLFSAGFLNVDLKISHRVEYKVFNLGQIDQLAEKYGITEFTLENLYINGLISQTDQCKDSGQW